VFLLVNLYSLFVYIEQNGDESPKVKANLLDLLVFENKNKTFLRNVDIRSPRDAVHNGTRNESPRLTIIEL